MPEMIPMTHDAQARNCNRGLHPDAIEMNHQVGREASSFNSSHDVCMAKGARRSASASRGRSASANIDACLDTAFVNGDCEGGGDGGGVITCMDRKGRTYRAA